MRAYDLFKEYIWLIQTVHRHEKISLQEINALWRQTDMSGGVNYSRTTFNRHKDAIQDIFGLIIECDRKNGNRYYIANSHTLEEESVQNWLLSTLSVNNIISEGLSVQERIQIESIPDDRFLSEMIDAMKKGVKVEIAYRRFGAETRTHVFAPYAMKVYQHRWYVLAFFEARTDSEGKEHRAHFAIFSFDRIEDMKLLKEKFKMPSDFNVQDFFSDCYGIVIGENSSPERVVVRAYGFEAYNMRALPLHHSQKEITATSEYSDFELTIKPTLDFSGKILSRGEWMEVLEPQWLRDDIITMHRKSLDRYQ